MEAPDPSSLAFLRAMSNDKRLLIVQWLLNPTAHFPAQRDGDLIEDGVCLGAIVRKIELKQPTVTGHLKILAEAELVHSKPIKNWVFYKVDQAAITAALSKLSTTLSPER
ncbi:ArsR/SmtB family transcription factor [Aureimonas pseudogalii]|uniref:ArsR family transcriptional regulator n=1 Tax=Aureimonas pseudogalii TaxID=1744844 RepID=A0A7W6MMA8_9HYPH|nr:helix-turn-helix transcriptional regulator [Aureimonas pseudogalii]MBB4000662.1 ArsR family transcriptional regulator [Aureimonas pseudogalii]